MQLDRFGEPIAVDDFVVTPKYDGLLVCRVVRFTGKMVKLMPLDNDGHWEVKREIAKYSKDTLRIEESRITMLLLRRTPK